MYLLVLIFCITTSAYAGECCTDVLTGLSSSEQVKALIQKYEGRKSFVFNTSFTSIADTSTNVAIPKPIRPVRIDPVRPTAPTPEIFEKNLRPSENKYDTTFCVVRIGKQIHRIRKNSLENRLSAAIAQNNHESVEQLLKAGAPTSVDASNKLKECTNPKIFDLMVQACVQECGDLFRKK